MIEYTVKVYDNRTEWLNKDDKLHRVDGPAIEYNDGDKHWYINGECHRDNDLPAVEWNDGSKSWYKNDLRHRIDGPAMECSNGEKEWYIEGIQYTEDEFNQEINPVKEMTVKEISEKLGCEIKIIK